MTDGITWPEKTRELHNNHFDSTIWNELEFRDDDIVVATYAKSGTTWMQQIIAQLLFDGAEDLEVAEMSPWLDLRVPPMERPRGDVREYFLEWLERDGYPLWPFWESVRSWWQVRDLPNLMLLHFSELKADMPGQIRRIAEFLEIPIREESWEEILLHCSFDYMKQHATRSTPLGGAFWDGGAQVFVNKGVNGRWTETLTPEDNARYEAKAVEELGDECARWLKSGSM